MNELTLRNFIRSHLDDGKPPTSVFHALRNAYPEEVAGIKRAMLDKLAEQMASERETLLATELGKRFYELTGRRSQLLEDVLSWMDAYFDIEQFESTDPGDDPVAIDEAVHKVKMLTQMRTELEQGKQVGPILRELSKEMPENLQKLAAELFPKDVPLR